MTTYSTDSDGKFIPASQRPDGTWRKARRVKEGYVPQEEVPLYESKGKQFAARCTDLPVGMCPVAAQAAKEKRDKQQRKCKQNSIPGVIVLPKKSSIRENTLSKPKTNQKLSKIVASTKESACAETSNSKLNFVEQIDEHLSNLELNENQDLAKKLKKLKKKMREIEAIELKIKTGELKKPDKDQIDKIKKKKEFLKEINELEKECEN